MKKKNGTKKNHIKPGASERRLKICAVTISLLFAALMLYPLIFAVSSAMPRSMRYRRSCFRTAPTAFLSS